MTFPGTTIETTSLEKGCSQSLFDGIFAAGGITLSQVSITTGLEPYLIQNWVKRGFLSSPKKRLYSREQFARIIIINMLRESLQIEKICNLIHIIGGATDRKDDDLISDEALYHRYVDMVADLSADVTDRESVKRASEAACEDFDDVIPGSKKQLSRILQVMLYAHVASRMRSSAEEILSTLQ